MKNLFRVLFFEVFCLGFFCFAHAASFVEGLEDVPLADGLTPVEGGLLNFGNEETRLIEASFTSKSTSFDKVSSFYATTLPQLGWTLKEKTAQKLIFDREGELLEITRESLRPLGIRLTVKSKN